MIKISKQEKIVWSIMLLLLPINLLVLHFFASYDRELWLYLFGYIMYFAFLPGSLIAFLAARRYGLKSRMGKAFLFFGLSLLSFFLGLLVWDYYGYFTTIEPYPSLAELFLILVMPFMVIGMSYIIGVYKISIKPAKFFLSGIIGLVWLGFALSVSEFNWTDTFAEGFDFAAATELTFFISDAFTFAFAAFLLFLIGGKIVSSFRLITFGFAVFGIANATFFYRIWNDLYYESDISDWAYVAAGLLMSIGIIHAYRKKLGSTDPHS